MRQAGWVEEKRRAVCGAAGYAPALFWATDRGDEDPIALTGGAAVGIDRRAIRALRGEGGRDRPPGVPLHCEAKAVGRIGCRVTVERVAACPAVTPYHGHGWHDTPAFVADCADFGFRLNVANDVQL